MNKYINAYGTLHSHSKILIYARKLNFRQESINHFVDELAKAFNELHNEDGTLKEIEGKDDD